MFRKFFSQFDWLLFASLILLTTIGIMVIYSTELGSEAGFGIVKRQLLFFGTGLIFMFVLSFLNYDVIKNYVIPLYIIAILTLIFVLLFGDSVRGSKSWFDIGSFRVQPSEFVKVITIIVLGQYFAKFGREMYQFRHVVISGIIVFIPVLLILIQPDLGSAMILFFIWLGMILVSGINKFHIFLLLTVVFISSVFGWFVFLEDYQKDRFLTFINPQIDPLGEGYNVIQSVIAVGSGGFIGKGLGHGSQSQLNFLPEQHTDFVFAVLAEELGFIGAFFLILLLFFFITRILRSITLSRNNFGFLIASGVTIMLIIQILINIGMNLGLLPVAGIPLPFLSYGGSSMWASFMAIGIVQSILVWRKKQFVMPS